jgi:hypothetical protein
MTHAYLWQEPSRRSQPSLTLRPDLVRHFDLLFDPHTQREALCRSARRRISARRGGAVPHARVQHQRPDVVSSNRRS